MTFQRVREYPDKCLKVQSEPVVFFDDELASLITDLKDTVNVLGGLGLSAPQIGIPQRVIYVSTGGTQVVLINPVIYQEDDNRSMGEGCLSFPGVFQNVNRFNKIKCRYLDEVGGSHDQEFVGVVAQVVQHEIDHLDGRLLIDAVSKLKRDQIKRKMKRRHRRRGVFDEEPVPRRVQQGSHLSRKEKKIRKNHRRLSKR